uniref:Uncharacterized protein n=1 Tax=Knipowitschia caucasica TaxID=637954 RepID=A0AAV2M0B0_KNICA
MAGRRGQRRASPRLPLEETVLFRLWPPHGPLAVTHQGASRAASLADFFFSSSMKKNLGASERTRRLQTGTRAAGFFDPSTPTKRRRARDTLGIPLAFELKCQTRGWPSSDPSP